MNNNKQLVYSLGEMTERGFDTASDKITIAICHSRYVPFIWIDNSRMLMYMFDGSQLVPHKYHDQLIIDKVMVMIAGSYIKAGDDFVLDPVYLKEVVTYLEKMHEPIALSELIKKCDEQLEKLKLQRHLISEFVNRGDITNDSLAEFVVNTRLYKTSNLDSLGHLYLDPLTVKQIRASGDNEPIDVYEKAGAMAFDGEGKELLRIKMNSPYR